MLAAAMPLCKARAETPNHIFVLQLSAYQTSSFTMSSESFILLIFTH